jgi:hypothetical protein
VLVVRRHAPRQLVGAVLLDRKGTARPPAVAIAVEVAQDRVVHLAPARRGADEEVLDEAHHRDHVSNTTLVARPRSGARELTTPDHHGRADQAALAARHPRLVCHGDEIELERG